MKAFLWFLPLILAILIVAQIRAGRIPLYWTPSGWRIVEKHKEEGMFWLFTVVEVLLMLVLIGQAITA